MVDVAVSAFFRKNYVLFFMLIIQIWKICLLFSYPFTASRQSQILSHPFNPNHVRWNVPDRKGSTAVLANRPKPAVGRLQYARKRYYNNKYLALTKINRIISIGTRHKSIQTPHCGDCRAAGGACYDFGPLSVERIISRNQIVQTQTELEEKGKRFTSKK